MNVQFFVPFQKFDEKTRRVYGVASVEEPDRANEIMDYATSKPYVVAWSQRLAKASGGMNLGNVRAMHGDVAAGHVVELECDDMTKSFPVAVEITDDNEWKKCLKGTYTGFSFGGKYVKKWQDPLLKHCKRYTANPNELSLADVPCVGGATITMVKADGTEEQIEVFGCVQQVWSCGAIGHEHFAKADAQECFEKANDNHDERGRFASSDSPAAHESAATAHEAAAAAWDKAAKSGAASHEREALRATNRAWQATQSTGMHNASSDRAEMQADRGNYRGAANAHRDASNEHRNLGKTSGADDHLHKANDNHDEKGRFSSGDAERNTAAAHDRAAKAHDQAAEAHRSGEPNAVELSNKAADRTAEASRSYETPATHQNANGALAANMAQHGANADAAAHHEKAAELHRAEAQSHARAGTRADNAVITRVNQERAGNYLRANSGRNDGRLNQPIKKSGADDDLHKATSLAGEPPASEDTGDEMDAKEKEELVKTLSAATARELKAILTGDDLKKTLTEIVTTELKKSDARFTALQEDIDTLGETFAKVMGVEVEDDTPVGESLSKVMANRLAKLLEEPDDSKAPLTKVFKDDVVTDDLTKAATPSDLIRASLRNPIPMFKEKK